MRDRLRQLGPNDRQIPRRTFNGLVRLGNALQSITGPNVAAGPTGVRIGQAQPRMNQVMPTAFRVYDAKVTGWEEGAHRWFTGRRVDAEGNELDPEDVNFYCLTYPNLDGDLEWHFPWVAVLPEPNPPNPPIRKGSNNIVEVRQFLADVHGEVQMSWWCTGWFQEFCPPGQGTRPARPPKRPAIDMPRRIVSAMPPIRETVEPITEDDIRSIQDQQRRLTGGRECCD